MQKKQRSQLDCPQTRSKIPTTNRKKNRLQQRGFRLEAEEYYKQRKAMDSKPRPTRPSSSHGVAVLRRSPQLGKTVRAQRPEQPLSPAMQPASKASGAPLASGDCARAPDLAQISQARLKWLQVRAEAHAPECVEIASVS